MTIAPFIDVYTLAARRIAKLPKNWIGFLFEAVPGQGVMVTGLVVTTVKTRGPNKGEPNFHKGDQSTKRTVFVSNRQADRARSKLKSPTPATAPAAQSEGGSEA